MLRGSSPTRRVEEWLSRVGADEDLAGSRVGLRYEGWAREELVSALASNSHLPDARCAQRAFQPSDAPVGNIDLLLSLGDILVVGEVKCLLTPGEPIEYANYGRKVRNGAEQAGRKADWVHSHRSVVAAFLGMAPDALDVARIVRLVVVNQGFGTALEVDGAIVVDLHFLRLYLSGGTISGRGAVRNADGMVASATETLYRSGAEAVSRFEAALRSPPLLSRFVDRVEWFDFAFPMASGGVLTIEGAGMAADPAGTVDEDLTSALGLAGLRSRVR